MASSTARIVPLLVLLAFILSGCEKAPRRVKGKLLKAGAPYQFSTQGLPPGDRGIRITFYPLEGEKTNEGYAAKFDPASSTFEVIGSEGKGIPRGKYRVAIFRGAIGTEDEFKDQFSKDNSPIIREIDGKSEIVIDLDKPEG